MSTPAERRARANEMAATGGFSFTRGQVTVSVIDGPRRDPDDAVVLSVQVMRLGVDITPPLLNPIRLIDPPMEVEDPAGSIVEQWDEVDRVTGQVVTRTTRRRRDAAAVLRQTIRDIIK